MKGKRIVSKILVALLAPVLTIGIVSAASGARYMDLGYQGDTRQYDVNWVTLNSYGTYNGVYSCSGSWSSYAADYASYWWRLGPISKHVSKEYAAAWGRADIMIGPQMADYFNLRNQF